VVSILDPGRLTETLDVPRDWSFIAYLCVGWRWKRHDAETARAGWQAAPPCP